MNTLMHLRNSPNDRCWFMRAYTQTTLVPVPGTKKSPSTPQIRLINSRGTKTSPSTPQIRLINSPLNRRRRSLLRRPMAATSSTSEKLIEKPEAKPDDQWQGVVACFCGATFLAALHRVVLPVLSVQLQDAYKWDLAQVGVLQSSVLAGYALGQVPSGLLSDHFGGVSVIIAGLALWSAATALSAVALQLPDPFTALLLCRWLLGAAQSCMMPAVSSAVANCVPSERRSSSTSTIYAAFSAGSVAGLAATPWIAECTGWKTALMMYGAMGITWAAANWMRLKPTTQPKAVQESLDSARATGQHQMRWLPRSPRDVFQLLLLCYFHSVVGWGFFMMQSWIPTYLHSLSLQDITTVGLLSALPWLVTALVGIAAGSVADWLLACSGWKKWRVRQVIQSIATLGPALSLVPLTLTSQAGVSIALVSLSATLALQGFSYAGFHAYVQDVIPTRAGVVLGLTNTCSTLMGIAANTFVAGSASGPGGYSMAFLCTSLLYLSSFVLWNLFMKGDEIVW